MLACSLVHVSSCELSSLINPNSFTKGEEGKKKEGKIPTHPLKRGKGVKYCYKNQKKIVNS